MTRNIWSIAILVTGFLLFTSANKVIELSDRFLDLRGNTEWMIMFYAPWCGHCKKMEPVWSHVAQALYGTEIRVGKVDCTRYTAMATEFKVRGFPTIIYLKGDIQHIFDGDRNKAELVGFANRMASPVVPFIPDVITLRSKIRESSTAFLYVGDKEGDLWESYFSLAKEHRYFNSFYSCDAKVAKEELIIESEPAIYNLKDGNNYVYPIFDYENVTMLNDSIREWIFRERFVMFEKINYSNLRHMFKLNKYLAITVVQEAKTGNITSEEKNFREMIKNVAQNNYEKYHSQFQFGWTGIPDVANSIAMEKLPLPTFMVINVTTTENYQLPDITAETNEKEVLRFLDAILDNEAPSLGGNSYMMNTYRIYYTAKTSMEDMWSGNPILTSVLFGLPMGFLFLICYSIWCSDILDADEEPEEGHHDKND